MKEGKRADMTSRMRLQIKSKIAFKDGRDLDQRRYQDKITPKKQRSVHLGRIFDHKNKNSNYLLQLNSWSSFRPEDEKK